MFSDSHIEPPLIQAYRETHYRVTDEPAFTLRIDIPSPELAAIYTARGISCSAFITAFNPFSRALSPSENESRHEALIARVIARGLNHLNGIGQHPTNRWEGETSLLILALPLDEARALGNEFEQNAIVWSGPDAVPKLILLR